MVKDGMAGVLAPLGDGLSAEKRALAENLRELFAGMGISIRRYAARKHLDAGTVSRYLNGARVPPWDFISGLIADLNREEKPVTLEVEQMLRELRLKASAPGFRTHELQKLQAQLEQADHDVRSAEFRQQVLTDALQDRQHRLADLERQLNHLEREREEGRLAYEAALVVWQDKYEKLREQRDQLSQEVGELREALGAARLAAYAAEKRCDELETELESTEKRLGTASARDSLVDALESADRTASVSQLVELVERLNTPVRMPMATELVKAAAQARPVADAAALIEALYAARQHLHAEAALPAMVVFRSVHDTASLIAEFARTELDPAAAAVMRTALEIHQPKDIAAIASDLHKHGLEGHVTALLGPAFTVKPLSYVTTLLQELEGLGALRLADQAVSVCARRRSVWDVAELIHVLDFWGPIHPELVRLADIAQNTAAAHRDAKDVIDLVDALRRHGQTARAEQVLRASAEDRTTGHVAALVTALHIEKIQDLATKLLSWAVHEWPVPKIAALITDLHSSSDWHVAVTALCDTARVLPPESFRTLICCLDAETTGGAEAVLSDSGAVCPHNDLAHLITVLDRCALFEYAEKVFWKSIGSRPTGHAGLLIASLHSSRSRHVSGDALQHYVRTRSVHDVAALALALDSAGMGADAQACLIAPEAPPFFLLLSTLDELLGGPELVERMLRSFAARSSVEQNVEMALALEALPARDYRYQVAFAEAAKAGSRDRRKGFHKALRKRKEELWKKRMEEAGKNVRIDRKNRHRKVANRIIRFPRQGSGHGE
ncbi:hypothetical protein EKH77_16415 [Streptomyces luteoverticillatus]|uniref:HTH cro/C1-type domain-containing protein n=1 Tax=Streptomyces luteoverticillatus TaxID=66425 RepID=A0A3Q9FXG7_STRLT|nr:hypothetical protein [Streptomyces luteoverticillatus]AZQ72591.1 hypothetical protein EKH77_16415 [Streptomyces luteoverticillatus]